jgi:streptogramin lyase
MHKHTRDSTGRLRAPFAVAVDRRGNVWVLITAELAVYELSPGQFSAPAGIAVDAAGNVYVADTRNHRVQKLVQGL